MNLTQRPPRSPRVRLGGYVILPRMLDKCRAVLADTANGYHYACPLDQGFLTFVGIDPEALKTEVAKGGGDTEILAWIQENAAHKPTPWEIAQWSAWRESAAPGAIGGREFLNKTVAACKAEKREDIVALFDLLDLDDHVSYGGKP